MIVSHECKFIFVKVKKTASTSIEIALSQFCGDRDILTRIHNDDEKIRADLGYTGQQNWKASSLYHHVPAGIIRNVVGEAVWKGYFKFCFERNPFDRAISQYYWDTRLGTGSRPDINDYILSLGPKKISNWYMYSEKDEIVVDFVGRYENLLEDLKVVEDRLGFPEPLTMVHSKGQHRENRAHYSEILNEECRARIEKICAREIREFDYRW